MAPQNVETVTILYGENAGTPMSGSEHISAEAEISNTKWRGELEL